MKNFRIRINLECLLKRFLISAVAIVFLVCSMAMAACTKASSTAVTIDELIRENYAAEREAEDDAKGREHIEIPDDAEEIEIEGETWQVIRNKRDFVAKIYKNGEEGLNGSFILANDLDRDRYSYQYASYRYSYFKGKFNGNNYKVYGEYRTALFEYTKDAIIENVIFSSEYAYYVPADLTGSLLIRHAHDTVVKNCVSYARFKDSWEKHSIVCSLIDVAYGCLIEDCINYSDGVSVYGGAIVCVAMYKTIINNCKNYGNFYCGNDYSPHGGIVGYIDTSDLDSGGVIIKNCDNFGNLVGVSRFGGIVGGVYKIKDGGLNIISNSLYENAVTISDCHNYGDIYLLKTEDKNRLEITKNKYNSDVYGIGGIAGAATKVENCTNEGSFYGFESFGKGTYVDYCGGVVGVAKEVTDCTNKNTIPVQKGRAKNVGEIYGILL